MTNTMVVNTKVVPTRINVMRSGKHTALVTVDMQWEERDGVWKLSPDQPERARTWLDNIERSIRPHECIWIKSSLTRRWLRHR